MSFALLAAALPGAVQLGQALLNKPKRSDYRANTAGQEKYIAHLRSKTAKSEVAHQALQPQMRAIGQQTRQTERKIQSAVGRGNLSASEEAQLQISQAQQSSSALQVAGETAIAAQTQENRRVGEQVAKVEANIAQAKEQAKIDFERATKQHKQQVTGAVLGLGANVASAGLGDFLTKQATSRSAFDALKAQGLGAEFETASDLANASVDAGFADSRQFGQMLMNQQKVEQSLDQYAPEEKVAAYEKLFGTTEFDIKEDLKNGGAQKLLTELGKGRTNTVMQASQAIANNEITDISQIQALNLSDPMKIQLANQLASQKASLADTEEVSIDKMIVDDDTEGLTKALVPGMDSKDATKITNALLKSQYNAEKKRIADLKAGKATPADINEMEAFSAAKTGLLRDAGFLVGTMPSPEGTELIKEIGKYSGSGAISEAGATVINDKINAYVSKLPEKEAKKMYRNNISNDASTNVSEIAAKKALITWLGGKVDNMLKNTAPIGATTGSAGNSLGLDL